MSVFYLATDEVKDLYTDFKESYERGDSGIDLKFANDQLIPCGAIPTMVDLKVKARLFNEQLANYEPYLVVPRSSIAKTPLGMANSIGVIDKGYQGNLKVAIRNYSDTPFLINRGQSLFQMVKVDYLPTEVIICSATESAAFIKVTLRGDGGFGSTNPIS